jgi:hypothetical protein
MAEPLAGAALVRAVMVGLRVGDTFFWSALRPYLDISWSWLF